MVQRFSTYGLLEVLCNHSTSSKQKDKLTMDNIARFIRTRRSNDAVRPYTLLVDGKPLVDIHFEFFDRCDRDRQCTRLVTLETSTEM
jgi:hypothetical protein